ncbi:MAG: DUF1934 domain-containing protein [Suipraeoptans sp.]
MNNDVILSITGLHFDDMAANNNQNDKVEVITPAKYYLKNDKHYILYEEMIEGSRESITSKIKLSPDKVEIIKGGAFNTRITFERDRMNMSQYNTPYGDILIGTTTRHMSQEFGDDTIDIQILYSLEINDEWVADCDVVISIKNKR